MTKKHWVKFPLKYRHQRHGLSIVASHATSATGMDYMGHYGICYILKELCHNILSHLSDVQNYSQIEGQSLSKAEKTAQK